MAQTIEQLLELQLATLVSLSRLLEQEKAAIVERKATDIARLATDKLALINQVQQQDHLIASHTQRQQLTDNPELAQKVDSIKATVNRCKEINDVNGGGTPACPAQLP